MGQQVQDRYSETRMSEDFTIYVLFSEPLEVTGSELLAALAEDYPGLDWDYTDLSPRPYRTNDVSLGAWSRGQSGETVRIVGMPGRCEIQSWPDTIEKSRLVNPGAADAVASHTDHLSISVRSGGGQSLAARFDAARRVTAIGAVLAKLPITLGVYFPSADLIVKPERWIAAADTANKAEVPFLAWMALVVSPVSSEFFTVSTIGLAAFNGHEIVVPFVPRAQVEEAAQSANATVRMLIESDHVFRDSDTIGVEGSSRKMRIRHVSEGTKGAQTDQWHLIMPESAADERALYGDHSRPAPPEGVSNEIRGSWNALKNGLYGLVASRR